MATDGEAAGHRLDDHGRALLLGEYDTMLACVRCGLCLTACPTYLLTSHEAEGPRGRIAMMRGLAEGRLAATPDLVEHERNCLVCDACSAVCPAGIRMEPMQVALRTALAAQGRYPLHVRVARRLVFRWVFADMRVFRLLVRLLWLAQRLGVIPAARRLPRSRLAAMAALLPRIPRRFVVPRGSIHRAAGPGAAGRVSLFTGCVMSTAYAEIDRAAVRVLQRAGCEVETTAAQGCCGALNAHGGDLEGAKALARRNIAAFERSTGPIAVTAAGCGAMLKDYAHHLRDDRGWSARAAAFSARVRDITELLDELPALSEAGRPVPAGAPLPVTFQDPCHLAHAQGIRRQPRDLLGRIPGVELREMAESGLCCGSAGVYNITNPGESRRLRERKLDHALATGAHLIVTANPGCQMQLQAGLRERGSDCEVCHIVELIDRAGRACPDLLRGAAE